MSADIILNTNGVANLDGSYTITGISGQRNGSAITSLLPAGANPSVVAPGSWYLISDNKFFPSAPWLDTKGVSYTIGSGFGVAGGEDINLYFSGGHYYDLTQTANASNCNGLSSCSYLGTEISVAVTQVPEPASLALLGLGLVGLVASRRRKTV